MSPRNGHIFSFFVLGRVRKCVELFSPNWRGQTLSSPIRFSSADRRTKSMIWNLEWRAKECKKITNMKWQPSMVIVKARNGRHSLWLRQKIGCLYRLGKDRFWYCGPERSAKLAKGIFRSVGMRNWAVERLFQMCKNFAKSWEGLDGENFSNGRRSTPSQLR